MAAMRVVWTPSAQGASRMSSLCHRERQRRDGRHSSTGAHTKTTLTERHTVPTTVDEYEQFVRARTPALLRSAYLLTGDQYLAEDLVQAALARTHRAWRGLRQS